MRESTGGLNRAEWEERLALLGRELAQRGSTASLTVVGSAPGILAGQPERTSMDLDVWRPTSDYDRRIFQVAVEAAGLLFDPRGDEPAGPYIQLVEPGIVQMGRFEPELVDRFGGLHVFRAPAANLVASKLLRVSATDLIDVAWWVAAYQPAPADIRQAIASFPREQRQRATENLVYLQVISGWRERTECADGSE